MQVIDTHHVLKFYVLNFQCFMYVFLKMYINALRSQWQDFEKKDAAERFCSIYCNNFCECLNYKIHSWS